MSDDIRFFFFVAAAYFSLFFFFLVLNSLFKSVVNEMSCDVVFVELFHLCITLQVSVREYVVQWGA